MREPWWSQCIIGQTHQRPLVDTACNLGQADPSETPGGHSVYHMLNTRLHVWVISIDWTFLQSAWLVEVYILQYVHIMPVLSFAKHVVV